MTTLTGKQIAVDAMPSTETGNLLRYNGDGLYVALAAAANVANQFVSSSTGNDANDGTRAAPLKTLARALERLPENTSGMIYLYETDTFPIRLTTDPQTWGTAISYYGSVLGTNTRSVIINAYGPQTDTYNALSANTTLFANWLTAAAPRPILEFGHYMFNGKPVGCLLALGSIGGQAGYIQGCDIRVADVTRAACAAANAPWTAAGNTQFVLGVTGYFRGCKLPSPIVVPSGKTYIASLYENMEFWQCTMPVESESWLVVGGTTNLNIIDSGPTVYDNTGTGHPTLTNTVATNIATRVEGVVKDTNGITRNVFSNVNI